MRLAILSAFIPFGSFMISHAAQAYSGERAATLFQFRNPLYDFHNDEIKTWEHYPHTASVDNSLGELEFSLIPKTIANFPQALFPNIDFIIAQNSTPQGNQSPLSSNLSFLEENVERVCDLWTDTRQAFDACVEKNSETGVEIFTSSDGSELVYPVNWEFCQFNQEIESEFGSNICEI